MRAPEPAHAGGPGPGTVGAHAAGAAQHGPARRTPAPRQGCASADWRAEAERLLARGRRFDRRIPSFLLRSPISRLGYAWGSAVGWLWGSLWSTGPVERRAGLWVFRGLPGWAFARGGVCVGGCYLTGDTAPTDAVLRHEAVHKRQWLRYGFLMPVLYLFAGRDPLRNRFEIEAGLEDGNYVPRRRTRPQTVGRP